MGEFIGSSPYQNVESHPPSVVHVMRKDVFQRKKACCLSKLTLLLSPCNIWQQLMKFSSNSNRVPPGRLATSHDDHIAAHVVFLHLAKAENQRGSDGGWTLNIPRVNLKKKTSGLSIAELSSWNFQSIVSNFIFSSKMPGYNQFLGGSSFKKSWPGWLWRFFWALNAVFSKTPKTKTSLLKTLANFQNVTSSQL